MGGGGSAAERHGRGGAQAFVLGIIFLKYISDEFAAKHAELFAQREQEVDLGDPENDEAPSVGRTGVHAPSVPRPTSCALVGRIT